MDSRPEEILFGLPPGRIDEDADTMGIGLGQNKKVAPSSWHPCLIIRMNIRPNSTPSKRLPRVSQREVHAAPPCCEAGDFGVFRIEDVFDPAEKKQVIVN